MSWTIMEIVFCCLFSKTGVISSKVDEYTCVAGGHAIALIEAETENVMMVIIKCTISLFIAVCRHALTVEFYQEKEKPCNLTP